MFLQNLTHDLQCLQRRACRAAPLLAAMSYMAPPEVRARMPAARHAAQQAAL